MDRPGLKELRADLKTDAFDAIYFLDFDRIARQLAYQSIVLSELVNNGKQIIIKGNRRTDRCIFASRLSHCLY